MRVYVSPAVGEAALSQEQANAIDDDVELWDELITDLQ